MARRRILHVIPSVSPSRGGPSFVMRTLARALSREDLEVHVATTDDDGAGRAKVRHAVPCDEEGATFWYFPRQVRTYTVSLPLALWLVRNIHQYDLVHIHALFSFPAIAAAFAARRAGVPYIIRPLGTLNLWGFENRRPWLKRLSFQLIEKRLLAGASGIHYTSQQELEEASRLTVPGQSLGQSLVIPNPVDCPATLLRNCPPEWKGRQVILFLSRLDRKKGIDLLLPAFAEVHDANADTFLVLAGDGDAEWIEGLRAQAYRLGIAEHVSWTGFLDGEEKARMLASADVFVLPSYSENFGVAAVEALAYGCPVIVSDNVGIHRELERSEAGLVTHCRVADLAAALARLLSDAPLRERLRRNGKRLVERLFSAEAVSGELFRTYEAVLQ